MIEPPAPRAAPMAPADRRAAIVEAVLPLVAERGIDVTSRELAEAAGVAEGTVFRAFGDKLTLVGAVAVEGLHRASGPEATRAELAAVDRTLPLEGRIAEVIELGRRRMASVVRWMTVLRVLHQRTGARDETPPDHVLRFRAELAEQREQQRTATIEGLSAVLAPDAHRLRVSVEVAVALVEATIAGTHARIDHLLPAPEARAVADVLVHGLVSDDRPPRHAPPTDTPTSDSETPHPEEP